MRNTKTTPLVIIATAALANQSALAQQPVGNAHQKVINQNMQKASGVFRGGNRALMLSRGDLQDDLGLSGSQIAAMKPLQDELQVVMRDTPDPVKQSAIEKKILAFLKPDQAKRLDQILLQISGANSLVHDAQLRESIGFSDAQVEKLVAMFKEKKIMILSGEEAMTVMTPNQKSMFKPMLGKKFGAKEVQVPLKVKVGQTVPNFKFKLANGSVSSLQNLRGKVVVLDFWATWCGPCIGAMPGLEAGYRKTQNQGVAFVPLCSVDSFANMTKWISNNPKYTLKFAFPSGDVDVAKNFGVDAFPTTLVIGRDGKLIGFYSGGEKKSEGSWDGKLGNIDLRLQSLLQRAGVKI